jgi:polysaccharide biosynthesis transport protein
VIERLNLRHDPQFNTESPRNQLLRWLGLKSTQPVDLPQAPHAHTANASNDPDRDEVLDVFAKSVKVQRRRNTYLIEVIATANDPVMAARIANAFVESYLKQQLQNKSRITGEASEWIEQKLEGLRQRVVDSDRSVTQYKAEQGLFDSENGQRLEDRQIARVMEQLIIVRSQVAETRAKYEQVQKLVKTPGGRGAAADVLESNTIRLMKDQLATVTRREAELETRYGARHPEMLKSKAQLKDIERQIDNEISQILSNYKSSFEVAENRERALAGQLDTMKAGQAAINDSGVRLRDLEREANANKALYESFLARFKQTVEHQTLQVADSRMVEAATVPLFPSAPKKAKIVAMGLFGGLGLALALVVFLEMMKPGLARPEEFERATQLPHLATVPEISIQPGLQAQGRQLTNRIILSQPEGQFAEAVRAVRHAVDLRWRTGQGRTILFASSLPEDGKSSLASNLAIHYASTGERVLLIDADLRRSNLTKTSLASPPEIGLFDCLAQRIPIERAILRDRSTGLCFLPAHGAAPPAASIPNMLTSPAMAGVLNRLRQQFDVIVIDSPPILPVVDARILAEYVDQILFVVKWRVTAKDTAQRGLRLMALNGRKFTGFIINQVPKAELGAAYGYGPESYRSGRRQVRKPKPAVSPAFARGIVPKHLLPKNAALVEQMT